VDLRIGSRNHASEQEGDRAADHVMAGTRALPQWSLSKISIEPPGEGGPDQLTQVPPAVRQVLRSAGSPLDSATRNFFEPRFGHDFSLVRIHNDAPAARSAEAIDALAYAAGNHIAFGPGQFTPGMPSRLMAHELAHVVQQQSAAAEGPIRRQAKPDPKLMDINEKLLKVLGKQEYANKMQDLRQRTLKMRKNVKPAPGLLPAGTRTFSAVAVFDADGKYINTFEAERITDIPKHAEELALEKAKGTIKPGGYVLVFTDQVACEGQCVPTLKNVSSENGVVVATYTYAEVKQGGSAGTELMSPKTTAVKGEAAKGEFHLDKESSFDPKPGPVGSAKPGGGGAPPAPAASVVGPDSKTSPPEQKEPAGQGDTAAKSAPPVLSPPPAVSGAANTAEMEAKYALATVQRENLILKLQSETEQAALASNIKVIAGSVGTFALDYAVNSWLDANREDLSNSADRILARSEEEVKEANAVFGLIHWDKLYTLGGKAAYNRDLRILSLLLLACDSAAGDLATIHARIRQRHDRLEASVKVLNTMAETFEKAAYVPVGFYTDALQTAHFQSMVFCEQLAGKLNNAAMNYEKAPLEKLGQIRNELKNVEATLLEMLRAFQEEAGQGSGMPATTP
jgi:hypothetical protein